MGLRRRSARTEILAYPGIVDQDVDVARGAEHRRYDAVERGRVGQIGANGLQPAAASLAADSRFQLVEPGRLLVDRGDVDAACKQAQSHRPPDAAGRTRHDRDLPFPRHRVPPIR
jgi:hypothetical protein